MILAQCICERILEFLVYNRPEIEDPIDLNELVALGVYPKPNPNIECSAEAEKLQRLGVRAYATSWHHELGAVKGWFDAKIKNLDLSNLEPLPFPITVSRRGLPEGLVYDWIIFGHCWAEVQYGHTLGSQELGLRVGDVTRTLRQLKFKLGRFYLFEPKQDFYHWNVSSFPFNDVAVHVNSLFEE